MAIENALAMMKQLQEDGFLKGNESIKKHVNEADDFELIRNEYPDLINSWFE